MEIEKAKKLIESTESDSSIKNEKFKGMQILSKYVDEFEFCAAHDILYLCDFDSIVEKMSEEDIKLCAEYGLFESEEAWAFFT